MTWRRTVATAFSGDAQFVRLSCVSHGRRAHSNQLTVNHQEILMALCEACSKIVQHQRHAPGHDDLQPTENSRTVKPFGQARVKITEHRCRICGTIWSYEDDKNDNQTGWSITQAA